jgi:DNA-binding XRE family transcriptional regulator
MERTERVTAGRIRPSENLVLTKAALRAADRLDVTAKTLATVIGVSEATISRMKNGKFVLERGTKPFELAALLVRLFRALDAIVGGDEEAARAWLKNRNTALDGRPIEKIQSVPGLIDAIAYLDARRALV